MVTYIDRINSGCVITETHSFSAFHLFLAKVHFFSKKKKKKSQDTEATENVKTYINTFACKNNYFLVKKIAL